MSVRKPRLNTARPAQSFREVDNTSLVFAVRPLMLAITFPLRKSSEPRRASLSCGDELDQCRLAAKGRLNTASYGGADFIWAGDSLTVASQCAREGCVVA